jgi:tripartite-type tricarboxylate transporter receptor subunit TctC
MRRLLLVMVALMCVGTLVLSASGQREPVETDGPWTPSRPIRIIVPWSAGGGTDILGRSLAQYGEKYFGVPVVVENVEGAMGAIGAQRVRNAQPDGYELLLMSGFVGWIREVQDYPVGVNDFTPVMNLNRDPAAFAVGIDSGIESLDDLRDYALDNPGEFTVSHSGDGGEWHIAGVSVAQGLGVEMNFVPFPGTAPGVAAVMGGSIDGVSGGAAEFVSQARANQLRVLAVHANERFGPLPDVPTSLEQGYDIEVYTTRGLVAPAGLPPERAQVLYEGFAQIMEEPGFIEAMQNIGLGLYPLSPPDYAEFLDSLVGQALDSLRVVGLID